MKIIARAIITRPADNFFIRNKGKAALNNFILSHAKQSESSMQQLHQECKQVSMK
uniref:Uncharacterized protein n=1 Tax=Rhizophora mucronata TaxID=61149 RepID=A0A2P2JDF2_RHIMU